MATWQHSVALTLILSFVVSCETTKPHIIFIVADDLGWNDVSFHGSDQIPTPNMDKLANEGVILFNYYVSPICMPTRSAIMTGKHPIHTGMQQATIGGPTPYGLPLNETTIAQRLKSQGYSTHMVGKVGMQHITIAGPTPYGLPLNETTIAQRLKSQGYSTHMVGKWHLGHFAKEYLPMQRGFDSHLGYYLGSGDYFDHTSNEQGFWGYDFEKNNEIYKPEYGQYSTEIFSAKAESLIQQQDPTKPLFLYLAYQAVHSANPDQLLQAPDAYVERFTYIKHEKRRMFAAMVSALDDGIGNVTQALKDTGLYNNSVIFFTTDNGGPAAGFDGNYANNWPLRGMKRTLWEGGVRGTGFVHSPLLEKPKRISDEMLHVCDWFPTMYRLAGGNVSELTNLDGYDVWDTLSKGSPSPRTEILHNIDSKANYSALRSGDYKILMGKYAMRDSGWYFPEGVVEEQNTPSADKLKSALIYCPPKPVNASTNCNTTIAPCLFNVKKDPCEFYNIAPWNQDIVSRLQARVEAWNKTAVPPGNKPKDPNANPKLHGGNWVPWITLTQHERIASCGENSCGTLK